MRSHSTESIIKYLKENIEPLEDRGYGVRYRASAYLVDGTYLPCVIFRNSKPTINLAIKRFEEERKGKGIFSRAPGMGYEDIVKAFVTNGNCVNEYDVDRVEISPFAFPLSILKQIKGETTMGWTGFAVKMKDGKYFGFGTTFLFEFFQMPDGYAVEDIERVINHSYVLTTGDLRSHKAPFFTRPDDYKDAIVYRERPFFECYIDGL